MRNSETSLMQSILGADWGQLPAPLQAHFNVGLAEGSEPLVRVEGTMDEIAHHSVGRLLFPLLGLFGMLVPYQGRGVPFSVINTVAEGFLVWHREFRFPGKRPYVFQSRMCFEAPGLGIEYVRFGLGIRMRIYCEDGVLIFEDTGFVWKIGRWRVPLPGRWLLGRTRVTEWVGDDALHMSMTLDHPWFGRLFTYQGRFRVTP
jgi:hypothetical protein